MRRRSLYDAWGYYFGGLTMGLIVSLVVGTIISVIFTMALAVNNHDADTNLSFEKTFYSYGAMATDRSPKTITLRKQRAHSAVVLAAKSETDAENAYPGLTTDSLSTAKKMAADGLPAKLDTHHMSFTTLRDMFLSSSVIIGLALWLSFCGFVGYAMGVDDEPDDARLASLPWTNPASWILTILMGPLGWACMLASGTTLEHEPPTDIADVIRTNLQRHRNIDADTARRFGAIAAAAAMEEEMQPTHGPTGQRRGYPSAPRAARQLYTLIRTNASNLQRRSRLQEIQGLISKKDAKVRKLTGELRDLRTKLNELRGEERELEEALAAATHADGALADAEFARIASMPGVIAMQVLGDEGDRLRFVIHGTYEHQGVRYDLGDWAFEVSPGMTEAKSYCLRSSVLPTWKAGHYPSYQYTNGSFCFGHRKDVLDDFVRSNLWLDALSVAVDCINSINPSDVDKLHRAFPPVQEERTTRT